MRLLLVEDSVRLQELLAEALGDAGYGLDVVGTVADLHASIATVSYDLVILDLGLPDGDGLAAIRDMRNAGKATPILVITARASVDDLVLGLDAGADDYLIKPFKNAELLARVRALMRRPTDISGHQLVVGNTTLDEARGEVRCSGALVDIRVSERRLLAHLMRRPGMLFAKAALESSLSEHGRELSSNAVEALISRTRKALEAAGSDVLIETVRGVGYLLKEKSK